jgi:hypothetical protein
VVKLLNNEIERKIQGDIIGSLRQGDYDAAIECNYIFYLGTSVFYSCPPLLKSKILPLFVTSYIYFTSLTILPFS